MKETLWKEGNVGMGFLAEFKGINMWGSLIIIILRAWGLMCGEMVRNIKVNEKVI